MSVRPSAWNDSVPTRRIFMKFVIGVLFENVSIKNRVLLKSDKNNGYFIFKTYIYIYIYTYIFDYISLNSEWNEKFFRWTL